MKKHVTLCADDFAQNNAISTAILELISKKRITATSCLTETSEWEKIGRELLKFKDEIDIGLHINLSENLTCDTDTNYQHANLNKLIVYSHTGLINPDLIREKIEYQLSRFIEVIGKKPDFLDGHQHVHHLPVIRSVILDIYLKHFDSKKSYIRATHPFKNPFNKVSFPKSQIIGITGGKTFCALLKKHKINFNTTFQGIYDFKRANEYPSHFRSFLIRSADNGIIMCHPGYKKQDLIDSLHQSRPIEFNYLNSEEFQIDCKANNIVLSKFCK